MRRGRLLPLLGLALCVPCAYLILLLAWTHLPPIALLYAASIVVFPMVLSILDNRWVKTTAGNMLLAAVWTVYCLVVSVAMHELVTRWELG